MPKLYNLSVWKGNNFECRFRFRTQVGAVLSPIDFTGSSIVFRVVWTGGSFRKESPEGITIDGPQGEVLLALTVAETRQLPTGKLKYEIERRIDGKQTTMLYGELIANEWANDDA